MGLLEMMLMMMQTRRRRTKTTSLLSRLVQLGIIILLMVSPVSSAASKGRRRLPDLDELELDVTGDLVRKYGTSREAEEWSMFEDKVCMYVGAVD